MKKNLVLIGTMLMMMAGTVMTACSSDDGMNIDSTDNNNKDDIRVLIPVKDSYGYSAISDFFYSELGSDETNPKSFVFKNNLSDDENPCIVINSKEEFEEEYTGDSPLPNIDFSNYTLIIGKIMLNAGTFIDDMNIRIENNKMATVAINCIIDSKGTYTAIELYYYYWNLFPKFLVSEIMVEVNRKMGEIEITGTGL